MVVPGDALLPRGEKSRRAGDQLRAIQGSAAALRRLVEERAARGRRALGGGGVMPHVEDAAKIACWMCEELNSSVAESRSSASASGTGEMSPGES